MDYEPTAYEIYEIVRRLMKKYGIDDRNAIPTIKGCSIDWLDGAIDYLDNNNPKNLPSKEEWDNNIGIRKSLIGDLRTNMYNLGYYENKENLDKDILDKIEIRRKQRQ